VSRRGDRERELAAYERERAAKESEEAAAAAPANRHAHETRARKCDEMAQLHERLADVYDREDDPECRPRPLDA
jgi:hypothetical protein